MISVWPDSCGNNYYCTDFFSETETFCLLARSCKTVLCKPQEYTYIPVSLTLTQIKATGALQCKTASCIFSVSFKAIMFKIWMSATCMDKIKHKMLFLTLIENFDAFPDCKNFNIGFLRDHFSKIFQLCVMTVFIELTLPCQFQCHWWKFKVTVASER